ncbi:hypothetical protein SK571_28235 [Lentzea sp. BCCO 10_0798]|uniref:Uncharacterized protein n=1 Tax=Lentzea kristufekii TaxID=3095430 RepID=A0ABU4TYP5_9PSEU|nr:hypothetical protein [Lentzea sp. BCCO 10_0798]MDX8053280.1 hypothetical protein [Lentzea sp. BCCO 10_0798]
MVRHQVGPDYEETLGAINRFRDETDGRQPGDPARAAKVILDVVASDEPPRRLVLGAAAVETVLAAEARRSAETEKVGRGQRVRRLPRRRGLTCRATRPPARPRDAAGQVNPLSGQAASAMTGAV